MQPLLNGNGLRALDALLRDLPLLAFDLDGTLAPIVDRPDQATVSPVIVKMLARIDAHWPVAVISGRSIASARRVLGWRPRHVLGSHGAEDDLHAAPELVAALEPVRAWCLAAREALAGAGIRVEDKGLSMALHYRGTPDPDRAQAMLAGLSAQWQRSVRSFDGKQVLNLTAATAPDKADGLERLIRRSGARSALFVGDDVNDEPVFERARPEWLTVKVGADGEASAARYRVDDIDGVGRMLAHIMSRIP